MPKCIADAMASDENKIENQMEISTYPLDDTEFRDNNYIFILQGYKSSVQLKVMISALITKSLHSISSWFRPCS